LLSSSIAVYHQASDKEKSQKLAESINDLLTKTSLQKKSKIKSAIKDSKHKLLENPFVTYYSTAENLLQIAITIDELVKSSSIKEDLSNGISFSLSDSLDLWDKKSDLYRSAFLMFLSSF